MLPLTHQLTNSDVCSARNDQIRQVTQQPPLSVIVNPGASVLLGMLLEWSRQPMLAESFLNNP